MTINSWLYRTTKQFMNAGIGTARLDALILLEDTVQKDRTWLLAHPEVNLTSTQLATLRKLQSRRAQHIPIAYVRGFSEFYRRKFIITPAVLEPRPESEAMIDTLKQLVTQLAKPMSIIDMGTGSGALGITASLETDSDIAVTLSDIDRRALSVAAKNASLHHVAVKLVESDLWLKLMPSHYDVVLANLPYVPSS